MRQERDQLGPERDISLFPTPGTTACDNTCSSGTPNGRFIVLGQDLTLSRSGDRAAVRLWPDYRAFASAPDRFNFAPFNYIQTPLERYGAFVNLTQEFGENVELNVQARSTTGAIRRTRRRLCRCSSARTPATAICSIRSRSTHRIRSIRSVTLQSETNPAARSSTAKPPITPSSAAASSRTVRGVTIQSGRHLLRHRDPRRRLQMSAGIEWYLGRQRPLGPQQGRAGGSRQHQCRTISRALSVRSPPAPRRASRSTFSAAIGLDHPADARLCRLHPARQQRSRGCGDVSANLSGGLFDLPGGDRRLRHRRRASRSRAASSIPIRSSPPASARTSPLCHRRRLQCQRGLCRAQAASASRHAFLPPARADRRRPLFRLFDLGFDDDLQAPESNWEPIEDLLFRGSWAEGFRAPSIGELFGTPSRFDQEVVDPCSAVAGAIPADGRRQLHRPGRPGQRHPTCSSMRSSRCVTGGNPRARSGDFGELGRRRGVEAELPSAAFARGQLLQHPGRAARSRRSTPTCFSTAARRIHDALSCDAINRTASGQITQIRGLLQNIAEHRDGRPRREPHLSRQGRDARAVQRSSGTTPSCSTTRSGFRRPTAPPSIDREGTEQGSPDQAFPKFKSTGIIDWNTGRVRRVADRPLHQRRRAKRNGQQRAGHALLHRRPAPLDPSATGSASRSA